MMGFEFESLEQDMLDIKMNLDMTKQTLCDYFKIKLNRLPNHQKRRYDLVADFINFKRD